MILILTWIHIRNLRARRRRREAGATAAYILEKFTEYVWHGGALMLSLAAGFALTMAVGLSVANWVEVVFVSLELAAILLIGLPDAIWGYLHHVAGGGAETANAEEGASGMKAVIATAALCAAMTLSQAAQAGDSCSKIAGDVVLAPRTPEVDLYDGPNGKRVQTLKGAAFPACIPITGRAPNMMLRVDLNGAQYWVPPYMVKYRFAGNLPPVCRNLSMGSNEEKVGATRGLGEGCPKPEGGTP